MDIDKLLLGPAAKRRRHWPLRRRSEPAVKGGSNLLRLTCCGAPVSPLVAVDQPLVSELVWADTEVAIAHAAWVARRPPRWSLDRWTGERRKEWRAWRADGALLAAKAERVRARAVELGVWRPAT